MIPLSTLQDIKVVAYEYMYSLSISTDKSEENAKILLKMGLGNRRITFREARRMATIYSEVFVEKLSEHGKPSQEERNSK